MKNLINIIEKLKVGSQTKIIKELENVDDFSKKYNCKIIKNVKSEHDIHISIELPNNLMKIIDKIFTVEITKLIATRKYKEYQQLLNILDHRKYYIESGFDFAEDKLYIHINNTRNNYSIGRLDMYKTSKNIIYIWLDKTKFTYPKECENIIINLFDYMINNI